MGIQLDLRKGLELRSRWLLPDFSVSYVFTSFFPLLPPYLPSFSPSLSLFPAFLSSLGWGIRENPISILALPVTQEKCLNSLNIHFLIYKMGVKIMHLTEF